MRRCGSIAQFSPRRVPSFRLRPETVARLAEISLDLRDGKARRASEASALAYEATMALYDDVLGGDGGAQSTRDQIRRVLAYVRVHLHIRLKCKPLRTLPD